MSQLLKQIKTALRKNVGVDADGDGYVARPQDNLVSGVQLTQFEDDLRKGAGCELRMKFCAIHSSAALAVNTFAPFKERPSDLVLLGRSNFSKPTFEKELDTGLSGTPPTLDVFMVNGTEAVAIESKFLEYFTPKMADFSASYTRKALPWAEDCWWHALEDAKKGGKRHLDVAQLVKHYFGISRLLHMKEASAATLLYLFWEPDNAGDMAVCRQHRDEVKALTDTVAESKVAFRSLTYPDLWRAWTEIPALVEHAAKLMHRYGVTL